MELVSLWGSVDFLELELSTAEQRKATLDLGAELERSGVGMRFEVVDEGSLPGRSRFAVGDVLISAGLGLIFGLPLVALAVAPSFETRIGMNTPLSDPPPGAPRTIERALGFVRRALRHWPVIVTMLLVGAIGYRLARFTGLALPLGGRDRLHRRCPPRRRSARSPQRAASRYAYKNADCPTVMQRIVEEFDLYPDIRQKHGLLDAIDELKNTSC